MEFYNPPALSSLAMRSPTYTKKGTTKKGSIPVTPTYTKKGTTKKGNIPVTSPTKKTITAEQSAAAAAQRAALARAFEAARAAGTWRPAVKSRIPIPSLTIAPPIGGTRKRYKGKKRYKGRKGYKGGKYSRRTRRGGSAIWRIPRFSTLPPTTTSPPRHPPRHPFRHPPPRHPFRHPPPRHPPRRGPPPRFPHSPIGIGGTRKRYKGRKGYKGGKYSRRKRGGRK
jgi:hypothetical protein